VTLVSPYCRKCICRRKSELRVDRVDPRQEDGTVQNNPVFQNIELPVRDDIEEKSPTSVSPGPGEEDSEQLRPLAISNQNNASICQSLSTQSTSSTTSTEEKDASVSGSVVHDTTDSQAIEITTTGGASMKEESHPPLSVSPSKRKSLSDQMPPSPRVIASLGIGSGSGFGSTNPLIKENDEESDPDSDET